MKDRLCPLIGISGAAGAGKDTLARGIAAVDVYGIYHFADPIKLAINAMFGFEMGDWNDREWKEEPIPGFEMRLSADYCDRFDIPRQAVGEVASRSPRFLAQTLGTEWGRLMIDMDIWLKLAQRRYAMISKQATLSKGRIMGMGMIIPDVRFENEAQWIKDEGGLLLHVERPGQEEISESSHASEAGFDPALINEVIYNDGPPSKMIADAREILWHFSGFSAEHAPPSLVST
jgi:hypothetical protein